jgi:chromosome segregation ATPase
MADSDRDDKDLETRVGILEREVARLREQAALTGSDAAAARVLAAGADHDVSEVRSELRAHTRALNALRETQLEQGESIARLEQNVTGVRQDVAGVKQDVAGLRQNVASIEQDMAGLRQNVASIEQDMAGVKQNVASIEQDMAGVKQNVASIEQDMAGVKQDVASVKQNVASIDQKMSNGFATLNTSMEKMTALLKNAGS